MQTTRAKYDRLIQDLKQDLRPQREWGEGRGIFMIVGHFVVGIAAGTWLLSLIFANAAGLAAALALGAIGGVAHLLYLGRPERFWRMALQFRRSWISRGFAGLSLFLPGAVLYLVPLAMPGVLWQGGSFAAALGYAMAVVGALILMGYMGFVYTASKGIPFWSSPLHPALYIAYAIRGGTAALLLALALGWQGAATANQLLVLWASVTAVVIVFFTLEIHGALTSGNAAARRSVHDILAGRLAIYFYGGTLALGLLVPAWLVWTGLTGPLTLGAMALLALASALGDFFMKYSTVRAGVFLPVWTHLAPQH